MKTSRRAVAPALALAAAAAIVLGACTTSVTSSSSSNPPGANEVRISDFAFVPATLTVKAGTTVTWRNQDPGSHTVTSVSGSPAFGSGTLGSGASYSRAFPTTGFYQYRCSFHPSMTGTVTVTN